MAWDEALRTVATIAGVAVAWYGVNTWRRQLRGNVRHEVARGLLRAGLRLRNQIHSARSIVMMSGEQYQAMKDAGATDEQIRETIREKGFEAATWKRAQDLWLRVSAFDEQRVEAEVLWGREALNLTEELRHLAALFVADVRTYFEFERHLAPYAEDRRLWNETAERISRNQDKVREIIMGTPTDDFGRKVELAGLELERRLRPHLGPTWGGPESEASRWRAGVRSASSRLRAWLLPAPRRPDGSRKSPAS